MKTQVNIEESSYNDSAFLEQAFGEQTESDWLKRFKEYRRTSELLKEKYSTLLKQEITTKQSKDILYLTNIFINIADSNIKLAQSDNVNSSLVLQYYNDAAIACHHGLSIIKNVNNTIKTLELQELESSIYQNLNIIQICMVNTCEGNFEHLQEINDETDINYIARRDIIQNIRTKTKNELKLIELTKKENNDLEYIEGTAKLFKKIASEMESYLATLYNEAENILGSPPCDYTVIGLGSMALKQMTPYSDLEFAILTANDEYKQSNDFKVREYFRNLTQIVHFKVINLGETAIPVSSYNINFKEFIQTAVNFDLGGKTPLGRMNKPYELIQTVDGMLNYLYNEEDKTEHIDKSLMFLLQKICLIHQYGENNLAAEYQSGAQEFLLSTDFSNDRPFCENRAVQILSKGGVEKDYTKLVPESYYMKGNLEQFSQYHHTAPGRLFNIKQEIYRLPDRFIYNLGLIFGVQEDSTWDTIDKLYENNFINAEAAFNLKKALSFATNLRLKAYSHYGYQKDIMDYSKIYDVNNSNPESELIEKELTTVFKLTHEDLKTNGSLFEFYYVTFSLVKKLKNFCNLESSEFKYNFFNNTLFYQKNAQIKAVINLRLLRYEQALKDLEKVLKIRKESLGEDHPSVAIVLNHIGHAYKYLGDYNKALDYQTNALEIWQKSLDQDHPYIATGLDSISGIYGVLGNHNKALESLEKALKIRENSLGENHPDVATILNNIGTIYTELGNFSKALEYQEKALIIWREFLGKDHPSVATCLNNIGSIYENLGNSDKALEYLEEALIIYQISLGEDHPDLVLCLNNIGMIYKNSGNSDKALEQLEKALIIWQKSLKEDHPYIIEGLNIIISIYNDLGNYDKALLYQKKILEIVEKSPNDDDPNLAICLNNIVFTYNMLGNNDKSLITQKTLEQQDIAGNITITIEKNSSFNDLPIKENNTVRVVSYNIVADFFDDKDKTDNQYHHWNYRSPFVKILLKGICTDIMCLQELSAKQALEMHRYFENTLGYKSIFLSQTPSEIKTGAIAYGEEVAEWQDKFLGTPLIGTFINKSLEFIETGRFWLNDSPDITPENQDRKETDKGFGNMNTYRAVLWAKVQIDSKILYVFNSHYPLSGNNETRFKCAELEMNKIKEITNGADWISVGDRNIIPILRDDNQQYNPDTVYAKLTKNGKNIIQGSSNHYGIDTTFIGFTYDQHKNQITATGEFTDKTILDVIVSSLQSSCSFHHHGAFDPVTFKLLSLNEILTEEYNEHRYFASDHALIGADLLLE